MATFHKPIDFNEHLIYGMHDFIKYHYNIAFARTMDSDISSYDDLDEIESGGGYEKGGFEIPISVTKSSTNGALTIATDNNIEFDSIGEVEPFQYVVLYTPDGNYKPIACWWDYGEKINLKNEVLSLKFGGTSSNGSILTII